MMAKAIVTDMAKSLRQVPQSHLSSKVDDELILIHGGTGSFFALKDVGLDIWEQIEAPKELSEIAHELSGRYEVDTLECQSAVAQFADDLVRAGLAEYT